MDYKTWYKKNKQRIRESKKTSKKKYRRTDAGRAAQRRYNHKPSTKSRIRNYNFKKRYGITLEMYNQMVIDRNSRCDICGNNCDKLHVDHSHLTGKLRGSLCGNCNRALGLLKDNVLFLKIAILYLEKYV